MHACILHGKFVLQVDELVNAAAAARERRVLCMLPALPAAQLLLAPAGTGGALQGTAA
jgi:hypothetical protein